MHSRFVAGPAEFYTTIRFSSREAQAQHLPGSSWPVQCHQQCDTNSDSSRGALNLLVTLLVVTGANERHADNPKMHPHKNY